MASISDKSLIIIILELFIILLSWEILEYVDWTPLQWSQPLLQKNRYPRHDTKLHLMVKLQSWKSWECRVLPH